MINLNELELCRFVWSFLITKPECAPEMFARAVSGLGEHARMVRNIGTFKCTKAYVDVWIDKEVVRNGLGDICGAIAKELGPMLVGKVDCAVDVKDLL